MTLLLLTSCVTLTFDLLTSKSHHVIVTGTSL